MYTALTLIDTASGRSVTEVAVTDVPMRDYTDAEIEAYIASGDPFDKAGGYAIQNAGFHPVTALSGCYANVVGLPLCHLVRALRVFGMTPGGDVPLRCQQHHAYECDVTGRYFEFWTLTPPLPLCSICVRGKTGRTGVLLQQKAILRENVFEQIPVLPHPRPPPQPSWRGERGIGTVHACLAQVSPPGPLPSEERGR